MAENDPFDLYKQKYDVMPVFRDTDLEVVLLYYQLIDKYSAG